MALGRRGRHAAVARERLGLSCPWSRWSAGRARDAGHARPGPRPAGRVDDFIAATRANHLASVQEPGNVRFDVLQDPDEPTRFILYEAYADASAAGAHKETDHYRAWREEVAPMMAEPRLGSPYHGLYPEAG